MRSLVIVYISVRRITLSGGHDLKNETTLEALMQGTTKPGRKELVEKLIDAVWQIDRQRLQAKIVHRALWHFLNNEGVSLLSKQQRLELEEMLRMLNSSHDQLGESLDGATKYCKYLDR
jgi:hypothetical protein